MSNKQNDIYNEAILEGHIMSNPIIRKELVLSGAESKINYDERRDFELIYEQYTDEGNII